MFATAKTFVLPDLLLGMASSSWQLCSVPGLYSLILRGRTQQHAEQGLAAKWHVTHKHHQATERKAKLRGLACKVHARAAAQVPAHERAQVVAAGLLVQPVRQPARLVRHQQRLRTNTGL